MTQCIERVAFLKSRRQCRRRATEGRFCYQHAYELKSVTVAPPGYGVVMFDTPVTVNNGDRMVVKYGATQTTIFVMRKRA